MGLVALLYFNSLNNAFLSDDIPGIVNNPHLGDIREVFVPPLNSIVYKLQYWLTFKFFGVTPWAFRSLNILYHIGSTVTIFSLVKKLLSERVALISAILFGIHPVLVESVAWISGGPYSRFGFFLLTSLFFYINSLERKWQYWLSLLFFAVATATSPMAVVFPLILFMYEVCFGDLAKNWSRLALFGLIGAVGTLSYAGLVDQRTVSLITDFYVKPELMNPFLQIPIAVTEYLKLIFFPLGLTLYHSELSFSQSDYLVRLTLFLLFVGSTLYCWHRNRPVAFFLTFFPVSLLVVLMPFGQSSIVAERYVYLGTFGVVTVVAIGLDWLVAREKTKILGWFILSLMVVSLSLRTIIRNIDWKNEDNLWIATGKFSPSSAQNHNNLGDVFSRRKDYDTAIEEFKKAISLNPRYADAYHNLGNAYLSLGKLNEAESSYYKALEFNPKIWQSYAQLAAIYANNGDWSQAKEIVSKGILINPNSNLLQILESLKRGVL